jgi:hypothetical protein
MSLHVSLRKAQNILAVTFLAAAACSAQSNAQQTPKAAANAVPPPSGKVPAAKTPSQAAPQQGAAPGGLVVFIDPDTGKIRQPDAAEIGALTGAGAGPRTFQSNVAPAAPTMISGPGGAVGVKLGDDSLSYTVLTKTPDGKLAEECVTGDKSAAALLSTGITPKTTAPKKNAGVLDEK